MIETRYDGPLETLSLSYGGVKIELCRPADPDLLLEDERVRALNRQDDYMPYWAYLWPGAALLAEAVAARDWPAGLKTLEIGCGLGLPGLIGLARGLDVTFTDYDEAPLRFVEQSASRNGVDRTRFRVARFDWREPWPETYPLILGADVLYEKRLVPLVCEVIRTTLAPGGEALIAGPYRVATEDLGPLLAPFGLEASQTPLTSHLADGTPTRGTLHTIWRTGERS